VSELEFNILLIVDLPARFNDEQENANAGHSGNGEHYKKCFHDLALQKISKKLEMIVPTDGSSCLLLSGAFGRSPLCWQPLAGHGPSLSSGSLEWTRYSLE